MSADRKHVLVTGTSTGIGEATALHLAEQGFHVFAGVRRAKDGEALQARASGPLTPLIIDVTKEQTISAARATVEKAVGKRGLAGVVNNAGIAVPGPLELQPMSDFRLQLETNLFGPLAVIQAFMPLIRRGNGRIVNVGSVGGMVVLPITGAYSVSKFGLHAMSDALRLELRQWGIHVSLVQVAPVESAIYAKTYAALDGLESKLGVEGYRRYKPQITAVRKATEEAESDAESAVVIAKAIHHALTSDKPKTRYLAGHGGRQVQAAAALPDRARDKALARELGLPKPE
jgi:NAD(P)-dependent dehydrogenase (short-subunit alcohol dehydrogenase family)